MPKMHVERSIDIKSTPEKVYQIVNNFNQWTAWSPWLIMDPKATVNVAEDAKYYEWEGKRVGSGNMKVLSESENTSIDYDLNFLKPWKSHAKVRFDLQGNGEKTHVTWKMDSSLPFYMFWMKRMMEAFVGMDYERGLSLLKDYVEDGEVHSHLEFVGIESFPGMQYIGIKTECSTDDLGPSMVKDLTRIDDFMENKRDLATGNPISIYHKFNMVKKRASYTSAVPVSSVPAGMPSDFVTVNIPATQVYRLRHTGPYEHLGNAWSTMYNLHRGKEFKMKRGIHPWETYVNDPSSVAQNELITDIRFAVK